MPPSIKKVVMILCVNSSQNDEKHQRVDLIIHLINKKKKKKMMIKNNKELF